MNSELMLAAGCTAEIIGLQSRPELNGSKAAVIGHFETDGRWEICVLDTAERMCLKPSCLVPQVVPGCLIEITGLQSRADLNGKSAKACAYLDDTGRWEVEVSETNETINLKLECIIGPVQKAARDEAIKRALEEEAARQKAAEEESKRKAEEEEARRLAEEEIRRRTLEAEARQRAEAEAKAKQEADEMARRKAMDEAKKMAAAKKKIADEAKKKAEAEAAKKAAADKKRAAERAASKEPASKKTKPKEVATKKGGR